VLIGTRPHLNVALAKLAPAGAIAVGQEHFHLAHHAVELQEVMQRWYPRLDAHVSLTERDAAAYQDLLGRDAEIRRIPNGIGDPGVSPSTTSARVVVAAGRLARQKGYDLLLPAWKQVSESYPDWQLRIFGEGRQRARLEAMVGRLGIGSNTRLAGFTDRLPHELQQGSFFVLSSRYEGLPMVLLEAMSCGLPVVSFDCPTGPSEVVAPGVDGLLVPPEDIRRLAHAMIDMIELGPRRAEMGAAAYAKSLQYRMPAIAAQWEALFEDLKSDVGKRRGLRGHALRGFHHVQRRATRATSSARTPPTAGDR
jgi:glycosyltransferase involved in cell wall biosynthesis